MRMITTVLFDLDGTLRGHFPPGREYFADSAARLGLPVSAADRLRACRWEHAYWAESAEKDEDQRLFPAEKAFWLQYSQRELIALGANLEEAQRLAPLLRDCMDKEYQPQDRLQEGAQEMLRSLRQNGLRLGVVSNREAPFEDVLARYQLGRDDFDVLLAAGEVQVWKPSPLVFWRALERLEVLPAEAVYVGDNFYADVLGASAAGLQPILFDTQGVFPEAECPVIRHLLELPALIETLRG